LTAPRRRRATKQSFDIDEVFAKGGRPLIDFLEYCVRSIQMDPVFLFLVRDYRYGPTAAKAIALYRMFCAPSAPGRISLTSVLPPYDCRLQESIRELELKALLPPKYLFDWIAGELAKTAVPARKFRRYRQHLTPIENLRGGQMTAVQRHFVQNIWQPIIRRNLTLAGFWRISDIA
jgi:hypothetical protein